jgi:hypothetical protein
MATDRQPWWAYVAFVGILAVPLGLVALALRPEGDAVAAIDLVRGGAIELPLASGDTLHFRADIDVTIDAASGDASKRREHRVHDALQASPVTVVVSGPPGERSTTCGAYDGQMVSSVATAGGYSFSGVALACTVPIEATGQHVVRARATWARGLRVSAATLEVRRAASEAR